MGPSSSRPTRSTELSFAPKTTIRRARARSPAAPFLAHSELGHDAARRQILHAALRKDPVQTEDVEAVAEHCAANLGRKAMPRAAGADAPSDLALPRTGAANVQDRLPHQFVRSLVDSGQKIIGARILRLVLDATTDESVDKLNCRGLDRHVAPIGLSRIYW